MRSPFPGFVSVRLLTLLRPKCHAEQVEKAGTFKGAWVEAQQLVWLRRHRLALGLLLMFVNRIAGLVLPATSKYLVDDVLGQGRIELLTWLALAVGLATVTQATTTFLLSQILGRTAQRTIAEMRKRVQQHVLRLPVTFFDKQKSGQLIARILNDAEGIRNLVGTGLVQLAGGLVTATMAMGVLFYLNWRLTSIIFGVLLFFATFMGFAFRRVRPIFRERSKIYAAVSGRLAEALGGVRVVKAYTAEKHEDLVFARGVHRLYRNVARTMTTLSGVTAIANLHFGGIGIVLILVGGKSILDGQMTLGDFVMYIAFTGMVAAPMVQIPSIATQLGEAFAGLDRIRELRKMVTEAENDQGLRPIEHISGRVEFKKVTFGYRPETPVLHEISFAAPEGSTTALVGPSGAGKSTLLGLIMAFHRPQSGQILVDGHDLVHLRSHNFRVHVGVVLQDNFLFDGTIAENIAYARPRVSREEIIRASKIAHCDEFIDKFELGYDTIVGERGVRLSGGQRQRVAIARAILADPRILLLDEATSSLDSESEAMIQDGLNSLRRGRTTFVIAHRLSTIRSADQILVLEQGQIVERGTHQQLLVKAGLYRQLHDKQYQLESNRFVNPGEDFTPEPARPTKLSPSGSGEEGKPLSHAQ